MNDNDLTTIAGGFSFDFDNYLGLWAVEESRFSNMVSHVATIDLWSHAESIEAQTRIAAVTSKVDVPREDEIAIISITGTLTKRGSSMSAASSMIRLRQAVRSAARDPEIGGILLVIDSPGGTVSGTADLANEVAAANQKKPVYTFFEDLGASAAYWIGSQAGKVFANDKTAVIGSIGTMFGLYDLSALAAKEGIRPVVIKWGKYKAAGFPGTEITDEQKAYWQDMIDKTQAQFTAGIAAGRRMSIPQAELLADGRVHLASDALSLNLIDGIQSFNATLAGLQREAGTTGKRQGAKVMSEETNEVVATASTIPVTRATVTKQDPSPAAYSDLKAECIGADAAFICAQLERKASVDEAKTAWMIELNKRTAAAQQEAENVKAAAAKPGVAPLAGGKSSSKTTTAEFSGDAIDQWNAALQAKLATGANRAFAVKQLVHENRELHEAYIAAWNATHTPRDAKARYEK